MCSGPKEKLAADMSCSLTFENILYSMSQNRQHSFLIVYYYHQVAGKRGGLSQRQKLQQQSSRTFRENIVNDRRNIQVNKYPAIS
jgi:hypothetical protein